MAREEVAAVSAQRGRVSAATMGAALSVEEEVMALAIRRACEKGDHFELSRLLRQTRRGPGGPCDAVDWNWKQRANSTLCSSPAHYAARNGHDRCLELLIDHGASVTVVDFRGFNPLHEVCMGKRKFSTIQLLRKNHCDVNAKNPQDGWSAAHICAHDNAPELLEALLRVGAHVDARTRLDYATPLHLAAQRRNWRCVALLLQYGAPIGALDSHKNPPAPSPEFTAAVEERDRQTAARMAEGKPPLLPYLEPDPLSFNYYGACLIPTAPIVL